MARNAPDPRLDSALLGRLSREASAGLARLRSAFQFVVGRVGSMALDDTSHLVGVARVCSMVLVAEPEAFVVTEPEPTEGPECRAVPWVGRAKSDEGLDQPTLLRRECVETAARLDKLEAAFRPNHPAVADRWAALASTVRQVRLRYDRSLVKAEPKGAGRRFVENPRPKVKAG